MKTVLVTGGAGFIGSHVVDSLLAKSYRVVCVDNFTDNYDPILKRQNVAKHLKNENYKLYEVDIRDFDNLKDVFTAENIESVIHLAGMPDARKSVHQVQEVVEANIGGTANLLELCKDNAIKNFVLASTSSIYGNANTPPYKETDNTDIPLSPYPASKKAAEVLAHTYTHNFDLPVTALRFFNVYGPRMRPGLVMYLWAERMLNDEPIQISSASERSRDYTYIDDIVDGVIRALERPHDYEIINLGNTNPVTLKDLVVEMEKATGKEAQVEVREKYDISVEQTCADITKAKELLGWEPQTSMDDGLKSFVEWFKEKRL